MWLKNSTNTLRNRFHYLQDFANKLAEYFFNQSLLMHCEYTQKFYNSMKITEAISLPVPLFLLSLFVIFAKFCYAGLSNTKILPKLILLFQHGNIFDVHFYEKEPDKKSKSFYFKSFCNNHEKKLNICLQLVF